MSRSEIWMEKKKQLEAKEARVKAELDTVSEDAGSRVKKVVIISLVAGVGVWLLYKGAKAAFGSKKVASDDEDDEPEQVAVASKPPKRNVVLASAQHVILDRLLMMIIKVIGEQLSLMIQEKVNRPRKIRQDDDLNID